MKKKIAKMLICTMIVGTMLTGCSSKVEDTITETTEELEKVTESTDVDTNNTTKTEAPEATTVVEETSDEVEMGPNESEYSDYEIHTFLPEEINALVPEHLDQWREYTRKILATYDAVNEINESLLGTACLEHMCGFDFPEITDFSPVNKDLDGRDFNINDFGSVVVEKYLDMYVNQNKRDIDFDQLYKDMTVDEAEEMVNAYLGFFNGVTTIYGGVPELANDTPFELQFNMNADFSGFEKPEYTDYNGHEWDYTDADDNFLFGTHYLYSFYENEVETAGGDDLGLCWYFDKDGNIVNAMIIQMKNN